MLLLLLLMRFLLLLLLLRLWFSWRSGPVAVNPTLLRVCASANCISCAVRKFNEPLVGLDLHISHMNLLTFNAEVCPYFFQILKRSPRSSCLKSFVFGSGSGSELPKNGSMQNGVFKLLSIGIISHEKHFDHFIGHAHPRGSAPKVEERKLISQPRHFRFSKNCPRWQLWAGC